MKKIDVAIVGATGAVGQETLRVLEEYDFPVGQLYLLASAKSAGKFIVFKGDKVIVEDLAPFDFSKVQLAFFSAGGDVSRDLAPKVAAMGVVVIDKSSYFRYDKTVPLVVPEINGFVLSSEDLSVISAEQQHSANTRGLTAGATQKINMDPAVKPLGFKLSARTSASGFIIANPNCSTIQLVLALQPLLKVGVERIDVATYQSISGAGESAVEAFIKQTYDVLNGKKIEGAQSAFNVTPKIDEMLENGYTKEEMKLVWETQKIFGDETIQVNPTAVRVPVVRGHSMAVSVYLKTPLTPEAAIELFKKNSRLRVFQGDVIPTPVNEGAQIDTVAIGRVRQDLFDAKRLNLWIVSDNLRTGAALNAVLIAKQVFGIS